MKYAITYTKYELDCARIEKGKTPLPVGSAYPVPANLMEIPSNYLIIDTGVLREKTTEEKTAYDDAKTAADEVLKQAHQVGKPLILKAVENNFLLICDAMTGTTTHTKIGFTELQQLGDLITDPAEKTALTLNLLSLDAQAKTEGGMDWWSDCEWHEEIVE
jgi:hypothetical protein